MYQANVKRSTKRAIKPKQDGFALMGVIIAIAIIGLIMVTYYWRQAQQNKITEAQILGNQLAQYVSAVQARMSGDGTFTVGTYSDLSFLKSNTCTGADAGTAPEHYLPCNFNFKRFQAGLMANDPVTEVTDMTSNKRAATITVDKITTRDGTVLAVAPHLGAVVSQAAQAHFGTDQNAVYNGAAVYHYDKDTAVITVDVNVQGTNSKWLCVDGCNKMQANLKFDTSKPVNEREIQDVSNIRLNNPNAEISSNGNLTIRSTAQMNQIAANILAQASGNFQATATNQAYVGGNTAKLVGSSQTVMATGSQQITIDPSRIVVDSSAFDNNASTINLNSTITNINRDKGTTYLGNQSGVKGNSNVIVNDLTIHSMSDQKLTDLLALNNKPYYSGYTQTSGALTFNVTTGMTGNALITVYGRAIPRSPGYGAYLALYFNGSALRRYRLPNRGNAETNMFQYNFVGSPNTTYSNFTAMWDPNNQIDVYPLYLGWSYYPF
ncbi:hypothetical protein [Cysteiniphilum marinum]|uniref:hypothetical protein n=1 Tax=Cysteiniphilum marinum TaxID=2774191 RepID=UPI00193A7C7F|nr:hypothetical protein [Cysteiniphilum marinum]